MRKGIVVTLAAGALLYSSLAFAGPKVLSTTQLDSVSAGSVLSTFLPLGTNGTDSFDTSIEGVAVTETGLATAGDENTYADATATQDGVATVGSGNAVLDNSNVVAVLGFGVSAAGEGNRVRYVDQSGSEYAVSTGDNPVINATANNVVAIVEEGSAAVAGTGNTVNITTDDTEIKDAEIACGSAGVIAKEAYVTDSFNVETVKTDIDVCIKNSFNVVTNTLDISGQESLTAIVNANTLGEQAIGVNLNATTATSDNGAITDSEGAAGGAVATTFIAQIIVNNSRIYLPIGVMDNITSIAQ